jgi:hypothetical protein
MSHIATKCPTFHGTHHLGHQSVRLSAFRFPFIPNSAFKLSHFSRDASFETPTPSGFRLSVLGCLTSLGNVSLLARRILWDTDPIRLSAFGFPLSDVPHCYQMSHIPRDASFGSSIRPALRSPLSAFHLFRIPHSNCLTSRETHPLRRRPHPAFGSPLSAFKKPILHQTTLSAQVNTLHPVPPGRTLLKSF